MHAAPAPLPYRPCTPPVFAATSDARPAWSEGRGPDPAPLFLVRWHPVEGAPRHDPANTDAEADALARDARDATSAEAAVYRLWTVLPD